MLGAVWNKLHLSGEPNILLHDIFPPFPFRLQPVFPVVSDLTFLQVYYSLHLLQVPLVSAHRTALHMEVLL